MAAAAALTTQLDFPSYVSTNPARSDSIVRPVRPPASCAGVEFKESGPGGGQRRNEEPSLGATGRGASYFLEDTEARQGSQGESVREMERGKSELTEGRESTSSESSIPGRMGPANQPGRERPRPEEPNEHAPSRESSPTSELEMRLWRTPRHPADDWQVSVFGPRLVWGLGIRIQVKGCCGAR
jgi:hypothetical protein